MRPTRTTRFCLTAPKVTRTQPVWVFRLPYLTTINWVYSQGSLWLEDIWPNKLYRAMSNDDSFEDARSGGDCEQQYHNLMDCTFLCDDVGFNKQFLVNLKNWRDPWSIICFGWGFSSEEHNQIDITTSTEEFKLMISFLNQFKTSQTMCQTEELLKGTMCELLFITSYYSWHILTHLFCAVSDCNSSTYDECRTAVSHFAVVCRSLSDLTDDYNVETLLLHLVIHTNHRNGKSAYWGPAPI